MVRQKIIRELEHFKAELNKETPIAKMILFGSQASGKTHRDSDIDLLIVSSGFRMKRSLLRGLNFYQYWNLDFPVDFLCYTPKEFKKLRHQATIVKEAVEKGIEIK